MPLRITTRKDRGTLWITGTVAGHRILEPAGTSDRRLAEERRAAHEAEIYRAAVHAPAPEEISVDWEAACDSYMDAAKPGPGTSRLLLRLSDHFGQTLVRAIDQTAIAMVWPISAGLAPRQRPNCETPPCPRALS